MHHGSAMLPSITGGIADSINDASQAARRNTNMLFDVTEIEHKPLRYVYVRVKLEACKRSHMILPALLLPGTRLSFSSLLTTRSSLRPKSWRIQIKFLRWNTYLFCILGKPLTL